MTSPTTSTPFRPFTRLILEAAEPPSVEAHRFELEQQAAADDSRKDSHTAALLELERVRTTAAGAERRPAPKETRSMATYRVYVTGDDADDVAVGSWFTIEAADDVDAANEALIAARDCGWTNNETTTVRLLDFRDDHECTPDADAPTTLTEWQDRNESQSWEARRAADDHSSSRRLEILQQEAPHLIAPDTIADLEREAGFTQDVDDPAPAIAARLEELRAAIRAENISYSELYELQSLAAHIEPGDVELLEAAGIPEHADELEALEPMDPRADVSLLTPAQLEQLATDHPETAGAAIAELVQRLEQRRPEPTTPAGETAHDLARSILTPRPLVPLTKTALYELAEELARLVLASDSLEELEP